MPERMFPLTGKTRLPSGVALLAAILPLAAFANSPVDTDPRRCPGSTDCHVERSQTTFDAIVSALKPKATLWFFPSLLGFERAPAPSTPLAGLTLATPLGAASSRETPSAGTPSPKTGKMTLDARAGVPLRQLLAKLGADVEWGNDDYAKVVMTGLYEGSPDRIAQKLLQDFNFAIFHEHSHLRVHVMGSGQKAATTKDVARIAPMARSTWPGQ